MARLADVAFADEGRLFWAGVADEEDRAAFLPPRGASSESSESASESAAADALLELARADFLLLVRGTSESESSSEGSGLMRWTPEDLLTCDDAEALGRFAWR